MTRQNLSIFSFKKFLFQLIIPFLFILILLGFIFNYFFEKKIILGAEISGSYKVNRIINQYNLDEIPFFGSSRAEGTFIPDSLVKNGFNYGMTGTKTNVLIFFLKEECKKKGKNGPIIINFDLDGLIYNLGEQSDYILNANYAPIKKLLDSNFKFIYNIPFLKYFGNFEILTKYYLNNKLNLTKFTNKGASIEKNELPKSKFDDLVKQRISNPEHFQADNKLLSEIVNIIRENHNRKFIFVINPYHSSYFKFYPNLIEAIKCLDNLRSFPNVVILDFSKINYPDNYFLNTTHLNLRGALDFNKILKDSLKTYIYK